MIRTATDAGIKQNEAIAYTSLPPSGIACRALSVVESPHALA